MSTQMLKYIIIGIVVLFIGVIIANLNMQK